MLNTPDHATILRQIVQLLHVAETAPELEDSDLVSALVAQGVPESRAWRLVVFVPIAFGRPVLEQLNLKVSEAYVYRSRFFRKQTKRLRDEAEYRAAEDHLDTLSQHPAYKALAARGPEINAVNNALNAGHDVAGGELQPVVVSIPRG